MTKSAVALAREALAVGRRALPRYSCPRSRHDYTQPQLFALLTLRQMLGLDYRGLVALVAEWGELRRALGLRTVPHYSTLCYAAHRLLAGAEKGGPSAPRSASSSPARGRAGSSPRGARRPPSTPPRSSRATPAPITPSPGAGGRRGARSTRRTRS
jgi:hypothetical protein